MSFRRALYEAPTLLTSDWGHSRIFAPEAYPAVRAALSVPIVVQETQVLARHVPLCWRRKDGRLHLVALMALEPNALRLPPYTELPLAIRAYPFVVPDSEMIARREIWVDKAIADRPTDIGAPLVMDDGKLSRAAHLRAQAALELAHAMAATDAISDDLEAHGFLEPWPLKFDLGAGRLIDHDDLFVLSAARLQDPALFSLVEQHGPLAGLFLGFHRASLFRINWLLANARAQARAEEQRRAESGGGE